MGRNRRTKGTKKRAAGPTSTITTGRSPRVWAVAVLAVVVFGGVWALRSTPTSQASLASAASAAPESQPVVRSLRVDVLRELSHERDAYIQGLVWWNDQLFESTGRYGESTLRRLDPQTGRVEQRIEVPDQYFGEGLALVDGRLLMLTWTTERAFTYDRDSFEPIGEQRVRLRGQPLRNLNELECVDGAVYANVWEEDFLVRIDPETGRVTDHIDAGGLLQGEDLIGSEVLNGIAYDPIAETFFITGKWWPKMFEVRFVE